MPNRFNDRENGESSYFPKGRREHEKPYPQRSKQLRSQERREWESSENESIQGDQEWSRSKSTPSEPPGEYGPSPRHARRGQDIQESYGGYTGQRYKPGVYGNQSPGQERYDDERSEYNRRRPYDPNYDFGQRQTYGRSSEYSWRDQEAEYSSGQRHSQYEQGPHFGKGPRGYRRSDQRIEEDINERLTQHPFIDATNIEVRVQSGEVVLSGTVDDRDAKRIAEDIVDSVSGVKEVQNQIRFNKKL